MRQYTHFVDIFKRPQITKHFSETLEQMPIYAKFTNELLNKKRRLVQEGTIELEV